MNSLLNDTERQFSAISADKKEMKEVYLQFDHSRGMAEQVAEWLDEAAQTLAALPATGTRPSAKCVNWPDVLFDPEDLDWFRESDDRMPRPTAAQVRRMDAALSWMSLIGQSDIKLRRVINMRLVVHPISGMNRWNWEKIGEKMGVTDTTAKRWHKRGCEIIGRKIAGM